MNNNIETVNNDDAKLIIKKLEQDKKFIIELREASDVFLKQSVETYYDFYFEGFRGSKFNCIFFYFPTPRQSDVGLFVESNPLSINIRGDHNVVEQQDKITIKNMRSFLPQNSKIFSIEEITEIKRIYLKSVYKTAEKVFFI
tara:strand:- start:58 stop:483 length:426 start_codon:yes stop_codon:yes gene_type:complete